MKFINVDWFVKINNVGAGVLNAGSIFTMRKLEQMCLGKQ